MRQNRDSPDKQLKALLVMIAVPAAWGVLVLDFQLKSLFLLFFQINRYAKGKI